MKFSSNNNGNSGSGGQKEIRRQQTTTQQIIAENVKHLIEQLEQGKSEALTAYLGAMARLAHGFIVRWAVHPRARSGIE